MAINLAQRARELFRCGGTSKGEELELIGAMLANMPFGFPIPPHDKETFAYFGSTNNIQTITYSLGGNTVGTLTFTYINGGAADDDDVETIEFSEP